MDTFRETDLYEPVRRFLEEEGYTVQAEVKGCDVAAVKNGHLVIVELKKAFNLRLVYQARSRAAKNWYLLQYPARKMGRGKRHGRICFVY